jgi:hypothetical protein
MEQVLDGKAQVINYICDTCHIGEMRYDRAVSQDPAMFKHICGNCHADATFSLIYPYTQIIRA